MKDGSPKMKGFFRKMAYTPFKMVLPYLLNFADNILSKIPRAYIIFNIYQICYSFHKIQAPIFQGALEYNLSIQLELCQLDNYSIIQISFYESLLNFLFR